MADEQDQVQTDQTETATTVVDPLDAANSQNGTTNPLSDYEAEVEALLKAEEAAQDETDDAQEKSADDEDETEQESDDPEEIADDPEEEEEEAEEPEASSKESMRPRFKDPLDIAVASLAKAKGISLVEAARIISGAPEAVAERTSTTAQTDTTPAETVASIDAQLKAKRAAYAEATKLIDVDAQADLFNEIEELRDRREVVRVTEAQATARHQQETAEQFDTEYDANWAKACRHYPELNDPNSAMYKKLKEIDDQAKELGDPLFNSATKPWDFAKRAAVATGTPMTKPAESKPKNQTRQGSPAKPASSNARTTSANSTQRFEQEIDGLGSLSDYEDKLVGLGLRR